MTAEELRPVEVRPTIHELSIIKQVIESRSHQLEVVRESLSNVCAPEVGAKIVKIQFYLHPDYGSTFIFKDDGCGMDYTGTRTNPGRLDRFLNLGFAGVVGLESDRYGWKGLGSKLMLNCRKLELITWDGQTSQPVHRLEVNEPRLNLLKETPEWPKFYLTPRKAESTDTRGTTITVYGYEGGNVDYSFEDLKQYLHWNTIVGYTQETHDLPKVFLKVGNMEEELSLGYPWLKDPDPNSDDRWKTVIVRPPIVATEKTPDGQLVEVRLKGGFTLNTANACRWEYSLSRWRYNTGLRLSVLGIPFFRLDFHRLKGERFQQYMDLCSFVVECDQLWTKLNIDRSGYNLDDPVVQAFERATRSAFDEFAQSKQYVQFMGRRRKEDEISKSMYLNERKNALGSPLQMYVCKKDSRGDMRVVHRVPENEADVRALFWKLEGADLIPFHRFNSLEHTAQSGIDVIATFQETEDSQLKIMEAVEFELAFENFIAHGHNPKQTSLVVCWEIRYPERTQKVNDWQHRALIGQDTLTVLVMSKFPGMGIHTRSEVE